MHNAALTRPSSPNLLLPLLAAKADRLKQAKDEAEREIAAFKAEREADFKRKASGHAGMPSRSARRGSASLPVGVVSQLPGQRKGVWLAAMPGCSAMGPLAATPC